MSFLDRGVRTGILTGISLLAFASSASAVSFTLDVWQNGGYLGGVDETALGCDSTGVYTATCIGGGATFGDLHIDNWSMNVDEDPVVTGITAVTNNSLATQTYTLIFSLSVLPVTPSSLIGGSIQGGVTDNNGDGATLATTFGDSFYRAQIDGSNVAGSFLYTNGSVVAGNYLSNNLPAAAFGTPIPSLAGPAVATDIGIRLKFTLTPGDSASFTSNFVVLPIPEPSVAALLGLGFGLLGVARKSRII